MGTEPSTGYQNSGRVKSLLASYVFCQAFIFPFATHDISIFEAGNPLSLSRHRSQVPSNPLFHIHLFSLANANIPPFPLFSPFPCTSMPPALPGTKGAWARWIRARAAPTSGDEMLLSTWKKFLFSWASDAFIPVYNPHQSPWARVRSCSMPHLSLPASW